MIVNQEELKEKLDIALQDLEDKKEILKDLEEELAMEKVERLFYELCFYVSTDNYATAKKLYEENKKTLKDTSLYLLIENYNCKFSPTIRALQDIILNNDTSFLYEDSFSERFVLLTDIEDLQSFINSWLNEGFKRDLLLDNIRATFIHRTPKNGFDSDFQVIWEILKDMYYYVVEQKREKEETFKNIIIIDNLY